MLKGKFQSEKYIAYMNNNITVFFFFLFFFFFFFFFAKWGPLYNYLNTN